MTTGNLLKSLIDLSGLTQKDFAEGMYTSPSKISRIINGNILIGQKEASEFSEQAARILAREIFDVNCHLKLQKIFPFILMFNSRHDLYQFILLAFLYTITLEKESEQLSYSASIREDLHYSGTRQIQYMFCIICSDYMQGCQGQKLEFFSSIPKFFGFYAKLFEDVMVLLPPGKCNITLHQYYSKLNSPLQKSEHKADIVKKIFEDEEYSDLYLWKIDFESSNHFFMLKDKFIFLLNQQLDGIPQMAVLRSRTQLEHYYEFIAAAMEKASLKSFSQDNIGDFLNAEGVDDFEVQDKIRCFNKLAKLMDGSDPPNALQFFDQILEDGSLFYITSDALAAYLFSEKISEKLLNLEKTSLTERLAYLTDFSSYLDSFRNNRIKIIDSQLFSMIVVCPGVNSVVSLLNAPTNTLKFHIIDTEVIASELERKSSESSIDTALYVKNLIRQAHKQK